MSTAINSTRANALKDFRALCARGHEATQAMFAQRDIAMQVESARLAEANEAKRKQRQRVMGWAWMLLCLAAGIYLAFFNQPPTGW